MDGYVYLLEPGELKTGCPELDSRNGQEMFLPSIADHARPSTRKVDTNFSGAGA
jgi:hypothetical protein